MTLTFLWLSLGAFFLGSCPFSVWIGRLFLNEDIRHYGDGNPGAANVFRAGSPNLGVLAATLDIAKGVPFVVVAHTVYHLPEAAVMGIGLSAILGHAFSPLLRFKGGKALAVTAGVIIGLLRPELFFPFFLPALLFFLVLESHAWLVVLTPAATLAYMLATSAGIWSILLMLCILVLFVFKQANEIHGLPRLRPWLTNWLLPHRQG
jgi:glycerol-3-phosphate acyltransferase PlsY